MANDVDPESDLGLHWFPDLSVQKLRIITVCYGSFTASSTWDTLVAKGKAPPNVSRYFNFLSAQPSFRKVQELFPRPVSEAKEDKKAESSVSI